MPASRRRSRRSSKEGHLGSKWHDGARDSSLLCTEGETRHDEHQHRRDYAVLSLHIPHHIFPGRRSHQRLLDIPCITVGAKDRPLVSADLDVALNAAMDLASGPAALILEVPQREIGGETTPWTEIKKLRQLCSEQRVWMHIDGARLWEILPFYEDTHGVGCHELLSMFDSVYVSFYEGLGSSLPGAVLAGDAAFVSEARVWLRRFGGNLYTAMPVALSALDSFRREEAPSVENGRPWNNSSRAAGSGRAARAGDGDSEYVRTTPPIPECGMCYCHILGEKSAIEVARTHCSRHRDANI